MSRIHRDAYGVRMRRIVTTWAKATPSARCFTCGRTALQHLRPWHAGHTVDGDPAAQPWLSNDEPPSGSWLRAQCEQCNTSSGAIHGNELRARPGTTRRW